MAFHSNLHVPERAGTSLSLRIEKKREPRKTDVAECLVTKSSSAREPPPNLLQPAMLSPIRNRPLPLPPLSGPRDPRVNEKHNRPRSPSAMPAEARRILKSLQADLKVDSAIVNSPRSGVKQCKDDGDKYDILRIRTASATPVVTSSVAKKISVTTDAMHQYSAQALPLYRSNRRRLSYGAVPTPNPDVGGSWRMNRWRPPKRTLLFTTQELDKIINQFDEIDVNQVGIITQSQLGTPPPVPECDSSLNTVCLLRTKPWCAYEHSRSDKPLVQCIRSTKHESRRHHDVCSRHGRHDERQP